MSIKKFPEERSPRYVPPEEDFCKVYHMAKEQDEVMLLAFLNLAARRGEIFGLTWADLDFSNNRVCLWTRKREGGHKESDWLPMTSELRQALLGWWQERISQSTIDKEHIFVCLDKTPFCEKFYGRPFKSRHQFMKKLCKKSSCKTFWISCDSSSDRRYSLQKRLFSRSHPGSVAAQEPQYHKPLSTKPWFGTGQGCP